MTKPRIAYRERLNVREEGLWEPAWSDEIIGWTRKFVVQNKWRTETINDIDDLMQDAHVVFLRLCEKYPRVVEPALFMGLYKTALWRHFMDRGRKLKNDILITRHLALEVVAQAPELKSYNDGPILSLLSDGPPEIRQLLSFLSDDTNLAKLREPQRKRCDHTPRKNIDQRLSSMLGIPNFPFRDTIRQWLFA